LLFAKIQEKAPVLRQALFSILFCLPDIFRVSPGFWPMAGIGNIMPIDRPVDDPYNPRQAVRILP
jgi:hypothetical protein